MGVLWEKDCGNGKTLNTSLCPGIVAMLEPLPVLLSQIKAQGTAKTSPHTPYVVEVCWFAPSDFIANGYPPRQAKHKQTMFT
eukprot:6481165-Amphidinium_carterae.1